MRRTSRQKLKQNLTNESDRLQTKDTHDIASLNLMQIQESIDEPADNEEKDVLIKQRTQFPDRKQSSLKKIRVLRQPSGNLLSLKKIQSYKDPDQHYSPTKRHESNYSPIKSHESSYSPIKRHESNLSSLRKLIVTNQSNISPSISDISEQSRDLSSSEKSKQ